MPGHLQSGEIEHERIERFLRRLENIRHAFRTDHALDPRGLRERTREYVLNVLPRAVILAGHRREHGDRLRAKHLGAGTFPDLLETAAARDQQRDETESDAYPVMRRRYHKVSILDGTDSG